MLSEYGVTQAYLNNGGSVEGLSSPPASSSTSRSGVNVCVKATHNQTAKIQTVQSSAARITGDGNRAPTLLLVSPDTVLIHELKRVFAELGLAVEFAADVEMGMEAMQSFGLSRIAEAVGTCVQSPAVVLLDARLPGIGSGRLLAAVHECGVHQRCAVALIAEQVSDEWIARLREGVIDDIVPRHADAATWRTHISTMQRGHTLSVELQQLREVAALELEHDRVTGTFKHEAMLSILFRETDRVQRLHGALSLLMVGLDEFDRWKSELGEEACDRLLREVAVRMGRLLRSYDVLGRINEGDFLLLLPGCSTVNAALLAERMRMDVFAEPFLTGGEFDGQGDETQPVRLTGHFAIAASHGRSPVVVMRDAEETLAKARQKGPDVVLRAGEGQERWKSGGDEDGAKEFMTLYPEREMLAW